LAAQQGEPLAFYALGIMAGNGAGVPQDAVAAYAFLTEAENNGYSPALDARKELEGAMTADEILRGKDLARLWRSKGLPLEQSDRQP